MEQAEKQMQSSSSAFMTAHAATMEVLGIVGKVQYHERLSNKGSRDVRCMFSVQWYLIVMKFKKDTSSVATGRYLKLL